MNRSRLIITCEHATNHVPLRFKKLCGISDYILNTHRGYDRGAREIAQALARACSAQLFSAAVSRLVIDTNRSLSNPASIPCPSLRSDTAMAQSISARYYASYRAKARSFVEQCMRAGAPCLHISVHTFAAVVRGKKRHGDIGFLYDPSRPAERKFALQWRKNLERLSARHYAVRFNYPYKGTDDGHTTALRAQFPSSRYIGIELEVSQRYFRKNKKAAQRIIDDIARAFKETAAAA